MFILLSHHTKQRIRELYASRFSIEELALMWDISERKVQGVVKGIKRQERV